MPPKPVSINKNGEDDPRITPWNETPAPTMGHRPRGRGLRDWLVLGMAFLLLVYVLSFLLLSVSGTAPSKERAGFFTQKGNAAWIPIQGEISSTSGSGETGYLEIVQALDDAENDPSVELIFLDIDSPGGSVVASKQIVAKIREMDKPILAWIGEVGASGAYYIASASDYIVTDEDSITGSIGVISMLPNISVLLDKIGISIEDISTGDLKGVGSPFNELTDEEKSIFQELVDEAFASFVSDVKEFRGEKLDAVAFETILDGRILSGRQALKIGLIDQTGTREDALVKAGEIMEIEGKPTLVPFIEKSFSLSELLFSAGASFGKGIQSSIHNNTVAGIEAK
ncbi:MAG: signal peptide peptidase SppA [Candidatus Diapherotrites archaeon]